MTKRRKFDSEMNTRLPKVYKRALFIIARGLGTTAAAITRGVVSEFISNPRYAALLAKEGLRSVERRVRNKASKRAKWTARTGLRKAVRKGDKASRRTPKRRS